MPTNFINSFKRTGFKQGFTLIELLLAIGLVSVLMSLVTLNLLKPQASVSADSTISTLIADIKDQQQKSMGGDSDGAGNAQAHGIFFDLNNNRYILFSGNSFDPSNPTNFIVAMDSKISLSNMMLPNSTVVFSRKSGEVANFIAGQNSFNIQSSFDSQSQTISINRYGTVDVN